jgi:hypothetical protein
MEEDEGSSSSDALNPSKQIPAQVSSQNLLSLPPVSSSDHIFTAKEQVRSNSEFKILLVSPWKKRNN